MCVLCVRSSTWPNRTLTFLIFVSHALARRPYKVISKQQRNPLVSLLVEVDGFCLTSQPKAQSRLSWTSSSQCCFIFFFSSVPELQVAGVSCPISRSRATQPSALTLTPTHNSDFLTRHVQKHAYGLREERQKFKTICRKFSSSVVTTPQPSAWHDRASIFYWAAIVVSLESVSAFLFYINDSFSKFVNGNVTNSPGVDGAVGWRASILFEDLGCWQIKSVQTGQSSPSCFSLATKWWNPCEFSTPTTTTVLWLQES